VCLSRRGRYYLPEKIITQGAIINRPRGLVLEEVLRADDIRPYAEVGVFMRADDIRPYAGC